MKGAPRPLLPGATIGILGAGQLGRMLAFAARRMGYRTHTLAPAPDSPAGQVADREVVGESGDLACLRRFAHEVDVLTYEFENLDAGALAAVEHLVPVRPSARVLATAQNRLAEKRALEEGGFPVTRHAPVREEADLPGALARVGAPAVLKTAASGYDGKGQRRVNSAARALAAYRELGSVPCVLEAWVEFRCELSVVAARGADGACRDWGVFENAHRDHILDLSRSPARVPARVERAASRLARAILDHLGVVGVMCVELFLDREDRLLVNELAPRPHNSGHLTIEASPTSQFEQQLRAVCALPLGATGPARPAAMANLLGDCWAAGEPNWAEALSVPGVTLHLYGKREPRAGRKMGHLTALGANAEQAVRRVRAARRALGVR